MKCKRFLSMLLTLCMVMSLFAGTTVTASAAGGATTLYVNGVNMLSESSTAPDGVSYDKSTNTLTLTDAELSTPYSGTDDNSNKLTAIIYSKQGLTINLVGNSTITYSDSTDEKMLMGIMNTYGDLKFTGDGSLTIKNAVESGGTDKLCYGIDAYGTLTVDGPTITIDAGKTDSLTCQAEYGVLLIGTFAIESGTVTIRTRNTTGSNTALYTINGKNKNNTLGSGAKLIAEAGSRSNASTNSYGIVTESSLQLGAGASLRASGGEKALNIGSGGTIKAASADLTLSATGSTTHKAATKELQTISSDSDTLTSLQYKTIEVTAAGGSTAQYATAELKLNGYTAGAALNQATITTTSSTGFESISLEGFKLESEVKFDTIGTFDGTKTYYVTLKMPRSAGYELQESDGKPVGVTLEGATPEPFPYNRDFLIFKMNSRPAAAASSPFTDGFGNSIDNASTYVKGTTTNDKGYTFAGWFDGDGDELDSADNAQTGEIYTAKWTKNGKTVRTTALDLRDATTNQNSTDEGWSWDAGSKTLTFSGATIDIPESNTGAIIAVCLPDGATVKSDASTQNTICNSSEAGEGAIGLMGMGALTIDGSGELSITGKVGGILSMGALTINAPLAATITGERGMAVSASKTITLDSSVSIKTPAGGKICTDKGAFIGDSNGTHAKEVVIGAASPAPTTPTKGIDYDVAYSEIRQGKTSENGGGSMVLPVGTRIYFDEDNIMVGLDHFQFFVDTYESAVWRGYIAGVTKDDLSEEQKAYKDYYYEDRTPVKGSIITLQPHYLYNDNYIITCGGQWMVTACGESDDVLQIYSLTPTSTIHYTATLNNGLTTANAKLSQTEYIIPDAEVFLTVTPKSGTLSASDVKIELTNCSLKSETPTETDGSLVYTLTSFTGDAQVTVTEAGSSGGSATITAVTVSPNTEVSVNKGGTQQFTATVSGTGTFDNTVTWKIENANSSNTTISDSGLLTVGADETASSISVIATSKGDSTKSCTVSVKIPQAAPTYTVQFNTNGGSAVESATVSEGNKLTAPEAPTKDGYTFLGWYKDAAFTNGWNFDADTVTGNTTLYAKWTETAKIYGVSGTVYESNGTTPASGVSVKLMKGDTQVASTTSATDGTYSFTGIASGVYNIVAEKDDTTQTTLVIVTNRNETGKNVTLPQSKVNSKLTVNGADTPDVVAGGLDEEAAAVKGENSSATSVKVEMTVESKSSAEIDTADKTNIETVASGKTLEYLDIKVTKTVDGSASAITTTANMMEIIIPYDMTGKSNITVYRNHSGSATAFTRLSTLPGSGAVDGTYYLDTANHLIYVYTKNFSTYAIGYNTQSGGGSGSGGSSSGGGSSSSSGGSSSGSGSSISAPSAKNGTVSVSPKSASKGTTVTVTVTPDKGYVLETLTVTDASGKKLDLKNLGSGKYSFTMPASKVEVKATFMEDNTMLNYFVDVPASAYYYDAVLWAAEQGITGGTDATHFSPDGVCTRAQAVTFLWRAAGSPAPSATAMPFIDVAADSYYYNAVLWAVENGITVGTSSTTFSPDLNCSRAQIVTFLWRSEKSPAAGTVNPFTDVSADAYYADAVLWAVKESVTSGTTATTFSPNTNCTRAQIVTFIWRTLAR